jgi:hypothetical protein
MIFRTEDDDDSAKISSMELKPHLRKKRKTMERATLDDDSSCEEDPEDKPGMFKRVIIRLLKRSLETSSWTDYASPPKFTNPWAPGFILPTNIEPRSSYHFNPSRGLMASEILRGADPSAFVSHPVVEEIASNLSTFDPEPFSGYLSSLGLNSGFFSSSLESEQSVQSHINVQTNPETMTSRGGSITQRPHITKADRARMEQEKLDRQKMATMTQTPGNHGGGMAQLASVPNMSNTKCPTCTWPNDRLQFSCVYCGESLDIRDLQGPNEPGLDPGHLEDANEQRFVSDPLDDLLDPFDYIFGTLGTTGSVPASPKLPDQQEHDYRDLEDPAEYLFRTMGTPALICRTLPTLTLPGGLFNTPMTPTSDSLSSATTLTSDMSRQNSAMGLNSVSLESIQMMRCSSDPAFYEEQQQQAMQ